MLNDEFPFLLGFRSFTDSKGQSSGLLFLFMLVWMSWVLGLSLSAFASSLAASVVFGGLSVVVSGSSFRSLFSLGGRVRPSWSLGPYSLVLVGQVLFSLRQLFFYDSFSSLP